MKKRTILVIALLLQCALAFSQTKTNCPDKSQLLEKIELASKTQLALEQLVQAKEGSSIPLEVMFKLDFSKDDAINARKAQLSEQQTSVAISKTAEVVLLSSCFPKSLEVKELIVIKKDINNRKLEFLNLPTNERMSLAGDYESKRIATNESSSIEKEINTVKVALLDTNVDIEEKSTDKVEVAKAIINGVAATNEKKYLDFLELFKTKKSKLAFIKEQVKLSEKLSSKRDVSEQLGQVKESWREVLAELDGLFPKLNSFSIDPIPTADPPIVSKDYQESVVKAQTRRLEIEANMKLLIEEFKNESFSLLSNVGHLRASLIARCKEIGDVCTSKNDFAEETIADFKRELKIIPLKLETGIAARLFQFKTKFHSGINGWTSLSYQLAILLLLLGSPFFLGRILDWVTKQVDNYRKDLISKSILDYRQRTNYAVALMRAMPFITPLGMLALSFFAEELILKTDLPELALAIFYLHLYYAYKVSSLLIKIILDTIFLSGRVEAPRVSRTQTLVSARTISRLVFIEIGILHFIGDTAREALVYNFVSDLIFWINLIFIFKETYSWRDEVKLSFKYRFPKIWNRLNPPLHKVIEALLLPLFMIMCIAHDGLQLIARRLARLDITKKVLSEIFKQKLQNASNDDQVQKLPSDKYLKYFDYYLAADDKFFIDREQSTIVQIDEHITAWKEKTSFDDLSIIIGNRGMGKTTTLQHIHKRHTSDSSVAVTQVPPKILTTKDLFGWLSRLLNRELSTLSDFELYDSGLSEKKVLFIDDIQNLFISKIGGFEAYETFVEILSLKTKNIYWCLTVNSRSWIYLKGIYGSEHFYGKTHQLAPWKDFEIQKLIVSRHDQTHYERSFDKAVKAYGTSDSLGQQAEGQFFRLLWGQSRGNPRSALMYWVSAISERREDFIHVGVPSFIKSEVVGRMSDEGHFLLAALARHDSLSYSELIAVTNIAPTIVRKCLKEFEDKNLTWTDENQRVRISSKAQYVVDYFLIGKNFLYE